ncbi:MAG TPA: hypothetical protein VF630_15355 [Hymenobacter sp.]|jgi:antitoxin component HigA of HigAB toxin-antitoxin module
MTEEYALWKHELRRALQQLWHINFYLGREQEGVEQHGDEFRDALRAMYTDCRFEQFFALRAWEQAGLSQEAGQQLQVLKNLMDTFDEPDTDAAILAHPQWHRILQQARRLEPHLTP